MTDANITMASSPPESQFQTDQTAAGPSSNGPNAANGSSARASASALNGAVAVNGSAAHAASSGAPDSALANGDPQDLNQMYAARREEEMARRDRSLAEFLVMLDGYKPLIPEEVTEYYLQRAGFECSDPRLSDNARKRLLSLSTQKFISDLARDAFHFAKLRVNGTSAGRGRPAASGDRNRVVLTMDDLSLALSDRGINVNKPDYYL